MRRMFICFLWTSLWVSSCKKSEIGENMYDGAQFFNNTSESEALANQMILLADSMKKGRDINVTLSATGLQSVYSSGDFSLQSATLPDFATDITNLFQQLEIASGNAFDPLLPGSDGGVYQGYLFDPHGAEPGEIVDKGLYTALILHQIRTRYLSGAITLQDLDNALNLYGAHPDFPNSDKSTLHSYPDRFLAKYAARRDNGDGSGVYLVIKKYFIKAQQAIRNGEPDLLNLAVQGIHLQMERAVAATIINYIYASISAYSQTSPTPSVWAAGLHATGEAIGFTLGLKYLPGTVVSDADIDQVLYGLRYGQDQSRKVFDFIQQPVVSVSELQQTLSVLQNAYGFTSAEMESFRLNQVNIREP